MLDFQCVRCRDVFLTTGPDPRIGDIRAAERRHRAACLAPIPIHSAKPLGEI